MTADLLDDALHDIPPEYRERARQLLDEPSVGLDALRDEVRAYIRTVEQVSKVVQMLDATTAIRLSEVVLELTEVPATDEASRKLIQLAGHYLVREDDDEEVTGVLGFDDDVQVVNAVCRALGREDLVTPLPSPE